MIGASGGLGRLIVARLEQVGATIEPVDTRRQDRVESRRAAVGLVPLLADLRAVVMAAPLPDAEVHRAALRAGCHVIDVTVADGLNRQLLSLDENAVASGRSMVAMAGLAPGLTGLLGAEVLTTFAPEATAAVVALLQSPTGAAGVQGTHEMLDLLTDPAVDHRPRHVLSPTGQTTPRNLFGLRNAEPEICGLGQRLELATGFHSAAAHIQLRLFRLLRLSVPGRYAWLRDRIAERKARTPGRDQTTAVSAVAVDSARQPVGGRLLTYTSDYAATAAVAAAVAHAAATQQLLPGAGHLSRFVSLEQLLASPMVRSELRYDTGSLPADRQPVLHP